ncbi:MAG: hypothetical protein RL553_1767 [Planctomycetota bacterium]|jgi:hypothetical protein
MVMNLLGVALLTTCFQQTPSEEWPLNTPKFQIPIRVHQERKEQIRELVLYVSKDKGKTWEVSTRAEPNQEAFTFVAKEDGPHWFSIGVVNVKGIQEPADIARAQVGQKVYVDTQKPDIKLKAEKIGEEIQVKWEVKDANPDINSMKLECKIEGNDSNEWIPISIKPVMDGSGTFKVQGAGMLSVRLQMSDTAANYASVIVDIGSPKAAMPNLAAVPSTIAPSQISTSNTDPNSLNSQSAQVASEKPADSSTLVSNNAPPMPLNTEKIPSMSGLNMPNNAIPLPAGNPLPAVDELAKNNLPSAVPVFPVSRGAKEVDLGSTVPPAQTIPGWSGNANTNTSNVNGVLASSAVGANTNQNANTVQNRQTTGASKRILPALQIVNKKQIRIDYEVAKFGPSGLGSVDVYSTLDDGQSWTLALTENSLASEPRGMMPVKASIVVPVAQEGVPVGYYVVVKSKAGLGKSPPVKYDIPHIRVEVDTTFPEAVLYSPQPEVGQRDTLVLTWKATDRNLSLNPVILEWSEKREGPWSPIGAGELPNTGKFSWAMNPNMPASVYLKLMVKDSAGNIAVAQTQEPLLIDLNVPEVNVLGISLNSK